MQQTSETPESAETCEYDPREVRRSFTLLFMDIAFFLGGYAFLDASTILPAFLSTLTDSSLIIGAVTAIRPACSLLPQLWTAHYLRNRTRHKSYLIKGALVSRVAIALFAITMFLAGPSNRKLMLAAFLVMYTAFWLSEGGVLVSWTDLVAKTIPERLRGRLFGLTQAVGGGIAILMGIFASRMLSPRGPAYPTNYAILYAVAAIFIGASLVSLLGVREPDGASEEHDGGFLDYARKIGKVLSTHRELKRLLAVQLLMGSFGMALPFYILYAQKTVGIGGGTVGILLSVQMAGSIIWSAVTGYLSDHYGPRIAIISTIHAGVLSPALALISGSSSLWLYGTIFFAIGGVTGTAWIGPMNFLLELAEPHERRSYIGVLNTANAPTLLYPVLGGLIVQFVSYQAVFAATSLALLAALVLAFGLKSRDV